MEDRSIYYGGAVKALGDNRVGGYLIAFTDDSQRDLHGEYFTTDTDLMLEDYPIKGERALYHHGLDATIGVKRIGQVTDVKVDSAGVWIEAQLEAADSYQQAILKLVESGKLGWSSGALPQSVRVAPDGKIEKWCVIEASLTPSPAMPFSTRIQTLKSLAIEPLGEAQPKEAQTVSKTDDDVEQINFNSTIKLYGEIDMNPDELKELVRGLLTEMLAELGIGNTSQEAVAAETAMEEIAKMDAEKPMEELMKAVVSAGVKAVNTVRDARRSAVKSAIEDAKSAPAVSTAKTRTGGVNVTPETPNAQGASMPRVSVSESLKYAHLKPEEMALAIKMLVSSYPEHVRPSLRLENVVSEDFARHFGHKMAQVLNSAPEPRTEMAQRDRAALKAVMPFKADELNAVAITGQGAELAGVFYDTRVWDRARDEVALLNLMESKGMRIADIPQGARSMNVKLINSSPTVYTRNEPRSTDATGRPESTVQVTPMPTSEIEVDAAEHYLATAYSHQLDEDSIIDIARALNDDIMVTFPEAIEDAFINGDTRTAANTNINLIDGVPAGGVTKPLYLAFDGIRKEYLVTNAGYGRDLAGVALSAEDYELTIQLMPSAIQNRRANMLFVMDYKTQSATRRFPELLTVDVAGKSRATLFAGQLPPLFGVDVYMSGFMRLTNGDGKISAVGGNNVKGMLALVHAPYWQYGRKRALQIESARDIYSGATVFVASARHILVARGAGAAAATYDILV
jgi:phage head maturation protease